jgi:hypothetical protein
LISRSLKFKQIVDAEKGKAEVDSSLEFKDSQIPQDLIAKRLNEVGACSAHGT